MGGGGGGQRYTFALTRADGSRVHGFCRRSVRPSGDTWLPQVRHPHAPLCSCVRVRCAGVVYPAAVDRRSCTGCLEGAANQPTRAQNPN
jgi:hypothetical protein